MKQLTISLALGALLATGLLTHVVAATIAKVDNIEISEEMFDAFAANRTRKPTADLTEEERAGLTEDLIKMTAIGAAARKQKLHTDSEVAAQLKLQELSFLAQTYIQRQLEANPVSEAQLKALYDERYSNYAGTEYKARHILVDSPTQATEIIGELDAGADFTELAAKYSKGPSAKTGGDLGWFTKDTMLPAFANAVAVMNKGTHSSKPVQTQYGWHIILKEDARAAPAPDLSSVGQQLQQELQQQAATKLVDAVREKAKVKTYK